MAIQNIYVLKPSGSVIFSKHYQSIKEDAVVVSGFLSAIETFAQNIGAGKEINSIETDQFKFVGCSSKKYKIKFVVICDKEDSMEQVKGLLRSMMMSFVIKYNKILRSKKPFYDTDIFDNWEKNVDKLINESDLSSFNSVVSRTMKDLKGIFKKVEEL
ncbi:MAG: hypothetical protein EU551_00575 [Promethearchaeota archaeon]|nr:MAG: hypothetical protein EU551_00575 [Candidatus Lokiarchaeota archaeon]